jgi:hypothetical protein
MKGRKVGGKLEKSQIEVRKSIGSVKCQRVRRQTFNVKHIRHLD